jgi:hypothetical protein
MHIQRCVFRRYKGAEWEAGIMLDWNKQIIDKNCKLVGGPIWDYDLDPSGGSVYIATDDPLPSIKAK